MNEVCNNYQDIYRFVTPHNEIELSESCKNGLFISQNLRFRAGMKMKTVNPENRIAVSGTYGLEQLDAKTGNPVVRCGFDILDKQIMDITHPPQGKIPGAMSCGERQRLRSREFRRELIKTMIDTASNLQLKQVRSIYSGDHYGIKIGNMNDLDAFKYLDKPFIELMNEYKFEFREIINKDEVTAYWVLDL